MCQEVYELVLEKGKDNLELQLALQCAPLISGLKISNLLITKSGNLVPVQKMLQRSGLSHLLLYRTEQRLELLLFRVEELEAYLEKPEVYAMLKRLGYRGHSLTKLLLYFQKRYRIYKAGNLGFPHEFGLFLGYPVEDVCGFMEHHGRNFLYNGYWKVYGELPDKLKLFQRFVFAEQALARLLSEGIQLTEALQNKELVTGRMPSAALEPGMADC